MAEDKAVSEVVPATEKEGPVLKTHMNRIRAVKKKLRKIDALLQLVSEGKEINSDQQGTINTKEGCEAVADELERMLPQINQAVKEEHGVARKAAMEEMKTTIEAEVAGKVELLRAEAASKDTLIGNLREGMEQQQQQIQQLEEELSLIQAQQEENANQQEGLEKAIGDVLALIYFGQLFNQAKSWPAELERQSCISYDSILTGDDVKGEPLQPKDLDAMVVLSNMMISRKVGEVQSHKNAIDQCKDLAIAWTNNSELFVPELSMKVLNVKHQLGRILASEYCSILPKVAGADEVAAGMNTYLPQLGMPSQQQTMQTQSAVSEPPPTLHATQVPDSDIVVAQQQQLYQPGAIHQDIVEVVTSSEINQQPEFGGNRQVAAYPPPGTYPQVQNGIQTSELSVSTAQQFTPMPIEMQPEKQQQHHQQPQQQQQNMPQYVMQQQGGYVSNQGQYQQQGGRGGRARGGQVGRGGGYTGGRGSKGQYGRGAYGGNVGRGYGGRQAGQFQQ
eukprot:TRINITY_DN7606_c0_g1_i1.p1 TRINITY_DN7606_c0_g1~~TRINITY_DN7606_c0_g1_i1.p1  ORF type:complete len:504 (-),score=89.18 TRINITY_DN7606_c0_g1_i1:418-1929(-)